MRKPWMLLIFFAIMSCAPLMNAQEKVPNYSEKYVIPSFTLYIVDDNTQWNELTQHYVGKWGNQICGLHIEITIKEKKRGKWVVTGKKHVIYLPKYADHKIHTESLGHEILHIIEDEYPLFTKFYHVDKYINITPKECE